MASRGTAVSGYLPCFGGEDGAQVYGADIASSSITSAHIAPGTVVAGDIADGSITSAKIGTGAVVAAKIGANAITSAKVATNAIVRSKMRQSVTTGTVVSAGVAQAHAHGLSGTPSLVIVTPLFAKTDVLSATTGVVAGAAAASAVTSTNVYVIGNKAAVKYRVFALI